MKTTRTPSSQDYRHMHDPGPELYSWVAYDYHPHERGLIWHIVFALVVLGSAIWAYYSGGNWGWITSFCIFFMAAVYLWTHRNGHEFHEIRIFRRGLLVDGKDYFPWEQIGGYWIMYDEYIGVVKFLHKLRVGEREITLQIGNAIKEDLEDALIRAELTELEDKQESLVDLWMRVFKL